jgi:hypothetical protein
LLRHTTVSLLLDDGASIEEVADLLGDDPRTLYRYYRHKVRPVANVGLRMERVLSAATSVRLMAIEWTKSERVRVSVADLTPAHYAEYWESVAAPGVWVWIVHDRTNPSPNLGKGMWGGTSDSGPAAQAAVEEFAKTFSG